MSIITLKGQPIKTIGVLPKIGSQAPNFTLIDKHLNEVSLSDIKNQKVILNIFPSIDTDTCALSVKHFNQYAASLNQVKVLCISKDLPFAQARFCGAEGIDNVLVLSDYATGAFGKQYGLEIVDPPLRNLLSRVIIIIDQQGKIIYTEQVSEIADEPDYEQALRVLKQ